MQHTRRWVLGKGLAGSVLAAAGCLLPDAALAQANGRRSIFGVTLPEEVEALLPQAGLDVLSTVETVLALEREAEVRRLPRSALELLTGSALPTDLDDLYTAALPRLVALIDRASGPRADGGLGNRAAELLARLHGQEHDVPEALRPRPIAALHAPPLARSPMLARLMAQADQPLPEMMGDPVPVMAEPVVQPLPDDAADAASEALPDAGIEADPAAAPGQLGPPSRVTRFEDLAGEYEAWFAAAAVRRERLDTVQWYRTMLLQSRRRYEGVSQRTGVPWFFVGATHALEASFNFRGHLHNGDFPLTQRTRQVPAGRPTVWLPPSDWESSAVDAMRMMGFAGQTDWSLARTLYRLEAYNGFGYRRRGVPTPYLWSFSHHYERGKFVADGRFSPAARSQQCGAAVVLKLMVAEGDIALG